MPIGGERITTVHGQIPGTPLDRRVRVTGGQLTSLKKTLAKVKENLEAHIKVREQELSDLRGQIIVMEKLYEGALKEKREKEPGTAIVPGLTQRRGRPPGVATQEEWVELRKSGKYLEYL